MRILLLALLWVLPSLGTAACQIPGADPAPGDSAETSSSMASTPSTPPPMVTDGRFDDWAGVEPLLDDPADVLPDAAVDLGAVRLRDEPAYLHLDLEVGRPVNALGLRGTIRVVLDADGDPATGGLVDGLEGTDAVVVLSPLDRPRGGGYGLGAGIRVVAGGGGDGNGNGNGDGPGPLQPAARLGLLVAPTQASDRLEMRLDRGISLAGPGLLAGETVRLRVVYAAEGETAERVVDSTDIGRYRFATDFEPAPPPAPYDLSKTEGSVRVVVWNVAGRRLAAAPGPFARVLSAIQPDVVLLDEAHGSLADEELDRFFTSLDPSPTDPPWSWVMGESGGRQRGVVASRAPLRPVPSLVGPVPYPESRLERLAAELGEDLGEESFGGLARVEMQAGLAVAGAWVALGGSGMEGEAREILFVAVDLQSRGYLGSPEDRLRSLQAEAIRERVHQVLRDRLENSGEDGSEDWGEVQGKPWGVVVAGDLNLVGGWDPLDRLVAGLDFTGTGVPGRLEVAECPTLDGRSWTTWRATHSPDSRFTPGRLDFQLYSGSTLEPVRGFAFDAGELPATQRRELGLEDDDSRVTSDHLPVVVDYRWRDTLEP